MYEKDEKKISVDDYLRDYVNAAEFLEYCKECSNYDRVWSCPPYDFEPEDYWKRYGTLHVQGCKLGIELEWIEEGKVPGYFVLVGGLLEK